MLTEILVPFGRQTEITFVVVVSGADQPVASDLTIHPATFAGAPITLGKKAGAQMYEAPAEPPVAAAPGATPPFTNLHKVGLAVESTNDQGFAGQKVQFFLTVGGTKVDPAKGLVTWSLVAPHDGTPPTGKLPAIDPHTGELTGGGAGSGAKVHAEIDAELLAVWPADWPLFVSDGGGMTWQDADATRVLQTFYGVFRKLPDVFRKTVADVRVYRRPGERNYYFPFSLTLREAVPGGARDLFDPATPTARIAGTCVHELSHAVMGELCKATLFTFVAEASAAAAAIVTIATGAALLTGLAAIPISLGAALFVFDGTLTNLASARDAMSEFSEATSWAMDDFRWHAVPLVGWLIGAFTELPPNYVFATFNAAERYNGIFNLHNKKYGSGYKDWWQNAGFVSLYSTNDPQEDFAEAMTSYYLDHGWIQGYYGTMRGVFAKIDPVDPRFKFIDKRCTDGTSWFDASKKTWNDIHEEEAWRYRGVRFDLDHLEKRPEASVKTASVDRADLEAQATQLKALFERFGAIGGDDLPALFARNRAIVQELGVDRSRRDFVSFLRRLDVHGDGLGVAKGAAGMRPGALLVATGGKLWMLAKTDDEGRPKLLAGDTVITRDTVPADLQVDPASLLFHWEPSKEPRRFVPEGQGAAGAYPDLEATLRALVALWGESVSPASKRKIDTALGFFLEILDVAGIRDAEHELIDDDVTAALNYMRTHGDGLEVFDAAAPPAVGDVVVPYHASTVGIVTRVAGGTADVLAGGAWTPGLVGEAAGDVQHHKGVDLSEIRYRWRPSTQPKTWSHGA